MSKRPELLRALTVGLICAGLSSPVWANALESRRDAREPAFAQVMYQYYQNRPYDALTTLLSNRALEFNATGTVNVLLGDLYARYGLTREADAALSRATNSDVTASNRNMPWLRYGKLLNNTRQDSLALNFLRKPPALLTPLQESERVIMVANILTRQERVDEAIEVLQDYKTPSPFYRQLARYNLALALLQPAMINGKPISDDEKKRRESIAIDILEKLRKGKVEPIEQIVKPERPAPVPEKKLSHLLRKPKQSLVENKDLGNASTLTASALTQDIEDDSITDDDRLNLKDKVALSLAYLHLTRNQAEKARVALRDVRLKSPYSNQALLTSAHVYFQLKDFQRAYNFATELANRDPADPMVQEGWLLAARALEELHQDQAEERYQQALQIYKAQTAAINLLSRQVEQIDILRLFPVDTRDPILLELPSIPKTPQAGLWAQLMDLPEVLSVLQQIQQTHVLQDRIAQYGQRIDRLNKSNQVSPDDQTSLKETLELYQKVRQDFQKAGLQDRKALIARVQQPLQQRQMQLDRYLTEALLGLQRLRQHANKDR